MPPKKGDSQMTLGFVFDTTRILLSMPSATPVSSLRMLLFPPLQLADSLATPPEDEDGFRVCRRVETAKEGSFSFSPLKDSEGTVYKAIGGDPNELLFIQFRSASGGWAPIKATIPSIEDQPTFADEADEDDVMNEDEEVDEADQDEDDDSDDVPKGNKGKGREVIEIN